MQGGQYLKLFEASQPVEVFTDASDYAVGGLIGQKDSKGVLSPVVFYSRKLQKAELNYSVTEKELLAIVAIAEAHRPYMTGKEVILRTDHRPLTWLQSQPVLSGRQVRWVIKLQEVNLKIEYLPRSVQSGCRLSFKKTGPLSKMQCLLCKDYRV